MELIVVIPFYNGNRRIADKLLKELSNLNLPTIVVDDLSTRPLINLHGAQQLNLNKKGYFSGAVNAGISACDTDVLVLNQDVSIAGKQWLDLIADKRETYAMIGERILGDHPAWQTGYIRGSFMFMRRDAITKTGLLDDGHFPHWGSTADWQCRAARKGFKILPLKTIPGWVHLKGRGAYGESTVTVLNKRPDLKSKLVRTPPIISVIVPSFNHGKYLQDAVNSLIGGDTSLGHMPGQTFQGFEIIIVDDASTEITSRKIGASLADDWKGIKFIQREVNGGTSAANNSGIREACGKYITVMCGDDMMESERLEIMLAEIEKNTDAVIYDDCQLFSGKERTKSISMQEYSFNKLIHKNQMHCGILFKKYAWEVVGGYPEAMKYGREDWAMNVALGINGYCGVHIKKAMYLYRRENQNRTLTNTTPKWREFFLEQLNKLYPRIYAGERPDMCCGNRATPKAVIKASSLPTEVIIQGVNGMTLLEYVGGSQGTQSWYGVMTGIKYEFGLKKKLGNVDPADLETFRMNKPGFLEIRENGKPVFKLAKVTPAKPSIAETTAFDVVEIKPEEELEPPEALAEVYNTSTVVLSTAAEKIVKECNINNDVLVHISGSGIDRKITVTDIRKYLEGR